MTAPPHMGLWDSSRGCFGRTGNGSTLRGFREIAILLCLSPVCLVVQMSTSSHIPSQTPSINWTKVLGLHDCQERGGL